MTRAVWPKTSTPVRFQNPLCRNMHGRMVAGQRLLYCLPTCSPDEIELFLDLDVIVQYLLAPFPDLISKRRHLVTQREWNPANFVFTVDHSVRIRSDQ